MLGQSIQFRTLLVCSSKKLPADFCDFRLKRRARNALVRGTDDFGTVRSYFLEIFQINRQVESTPSTARGMITSLTTGFYNSPTILVVVLSVTFLSYF